MVRFIQIPSRVSISSHFKEVSRDIHSISTSTLSRLLVADDPIDGSSMQPTRDGNISRRGVPAGITQEIDDSAREVVLRAEPLQRRRQPHLVALPLALGLAHVPRHVAVDEPGRDGVDADLVRRELDGQRPRQHQDAALAGVVGRHPVARERDVARLRGDEDDAAAAAVAFALG